MIDDDAATSELAPWWDEMEYQASLRDIPDEVWLALAEAEAARMPDPLADPCGPVLAGSLAAVCDTQAGDGELIDRISGYERQAAWAAAGQVRAIAELATRRGAVGGTGELAFTYHRGDPMATPDRLLDGGPADPAARAEDNDPAHLDASLRWSGAGTRPIHRTVSGQLVTARIPDTVQP